MRNRMLDRALASIVTITLVVITYVGYAQHQKPSHYEYYIDTDLGAGNNTNVPYVAGQVVALPLSSFTPSLSNGQHTLGLRFFSHGIWSAAVQRTMYVRPGMTHLYFVPTALLQANQQLVDGEFFRNGEAGLGTADAFTDFDNPAFNPANPGTVQLELNTASIPIGAHYVAVRWCDASRQWGHQKFNGFFVLPAGNLENANLVDGEFFLDDDPGIGNGFKLTTYDSPPFFPGNPLTDVTIDFGDFPNGLPSGSHRVGVRFVDSKGRWSQTMYGAFFWFSQNTGAENRKLVDGEFFIETDPGVGLSLLRFSMFDSPNIVPGTPLGPIDIAYPLTSLNLPTGNYRLGVRFKNEDGIWGAAEYASFSYTANTVYANQRLVEVEIFFDKDPGSGRPGTRQFTIPLPAYSVVDQEFTVDLLPYLFPLGKHTIGVRFFDETNNWGHLDTAHFTVDQAVDANVKVTSPNEGEVVYKGSQTTITWSSHPAIPVTELMNISYSLDNGTTWNEIVAGVENTGSYTWSVPSSLATSAQALILIQNNNAAYTDISDAVFNIQPVSFVVDTTPGNQTYYWFEVVPFAWTNHGLPSTRTVAITRESPATTVISSVAVDQQMYGWTIPLNAPEGVSNYAITLQQDNSYQGVLPSINIAKPSITAGAIANTYQFGDQIPLTFTTAGIGATEYIDIFLYNPATATAQLVANDTPNDGNETVTLPTGIASGNYTLKLVWAAHQEIECETTAFFVSGNAGTPVAAYSLRKLYNTYTGPVLKVQRATDAENLMGDFAEGDVAFDANGEVSLSSIVTITASGTSALLPGTSLTLGNFVEAPHQYVFVHTWYDQTGGGRDLIQTSRALQGRLVSGGALEQNNGRPGIRRRSGAYSNASSPTPNQNITAFAIADADGYASEDGRLLLLPNGRNLGGGVNGNDYRVVHEGVEWGTSSGVAIDENLHQFTISSVSEAETTLIVDLDPARTSAINGAPLPAGETDFGVGTLPGRIMEVVVYNENRTGADRATLECDQLIYYRLLQANAGTDNTTVGKTLAALNAITPSVGAGSWHQVSGPGTSQFSNAGSATSSVSVTTEGIYIYRWTVSYQSCTVSDEVSIVYEIPLPQPPVAVNGQRCESGPVQLRAIAGANETIDWFDSETGGAALLHGASSYTPTLSATTTFFAQARNVSNGLTSSTRTAVTGTINSNPQPLVTASGATTFCEGSNVLLHPSLSGGQSLVFNGTSTYASLNANAALSLFNFTIEFWIYNAGANSDNERIISTLEDFFEIAKSSSDLKIYGLGNGWSTATSLPVNEWTHIGVSREGTTLRVYKNGVQVASSTVTATALPTQWMLGRRVSGSEFANMHLEELRVLNIASTAQQVKARMNNVVPSTLNGLVLYYQFNEGSGTVIADTSPTGVNANVHNAVWQTSAAPVSSYKTYAWNNGAATHTTSATSTGSYSVTVTDYNNCQGTGAAVAVVANSNPQPPAGTGASPVTISANPVNLSTETIDWYTATTGGTLLLAGSTSYSPDVSVDTVFYAESRSTSTGLRFESYRCTSGCQQADSRFLIFCNSLYG